MISEKAVLTKGKEDCDHKFAIANKQWEEVVVSTDDPEKIKKNTWYYYGMIDRCKECGREELCGGTIIVPEGGSFMGGEYTLEPDGSRGYWIS